MLIVLDTDVVVASLRSRTGASRLLVRLIAAGRVVMAAHPTLFLQYEAVLTRDEHLRESGLTARQALEFLDGLATIVQPVVINYRWRPLSAHAEDDQVVEAAVNGCVDAVATFNVQHLARPLAAFGIPAHRPADLLRLILEA